VSELPEGWTEASFMEVFDIQGGTQPPKAQFKYEPHDNTVDIFWGRVK
jgi:type I restriction enzyme S subunit